MKNAFLILALIIPFFCGAQSECSDYFPYDEGTVLVYTNYDKKGKMTSRQVQKLQEIEETPDGLSITLDVVVEDKKGEEQMDMTYDMRCEDGVLYFDVRNMFNEEMFQSMQGMEFEMEGEAIALPDDLEVGQELPDAWIKISSSGALGMMNMKVEIVDRKVIGKEMIETEAGSWECYKVEHTAKMDWIVNTEYYSVDYYAEGVGPVRSETYNKKGKLMGTRDLTTIKKG